MNGIAFLLFYAAVITVAAVACYLQTRRLNLSGELPSPRVPENPDPYEIAYLRGGVNEVARVVVFNLVQLGHLKLTENDKNKKWLLEFGDKREDPAQPSLSALERATLEWCSSVSLPVETRTIFQDRTGLASRLEPLCVSYEERLHREDLLNTPEAVGATARICLPYGFGVMGLGAYKVIVALVQGHTNVWFTVILAIVGWCLMWGVGRSPRLSQRGQQYIKNLKLAFREMKWSLPPPTTSNVAYTSVPFLLTVAVFGLSALEGTAYAAHKDAFTKFTRPGNGSYGDGGCGGGDGGCGG